MKARQISRRALSDLTWSRPMSTNAAELRSTAPALSALARELGLPLPRAGHWMQKERGKEAPAPEYPAVPTLDGELYAIPARPEGRSVRPPTNRSADQAVAEAPVANDPVGAKKIDVCAHQRVASTRNAILKSQSADRVRSGAAGSSGTRCHRTAANTRARFLITWSRPPKLKDDGSKIPTRDMRSSQAARPSNL